MREPFRPNGEPALLPHNSPAAAAPYSPDPNSHFDCEYSIPSVVDLSYASPSGELRNANLSLHMHRSIRMFRRLVPFVSFVLLLAFMITGTARAQTATYHLHSTSSTTSGLLQLTTAGPNPPTSALLTANLRGLATGEYVIKQFDTQTGDPNVSGVIPSGSTLSFTLWMRSTGNQGTMFPRAKLNLNSAIGTSLCIATGTTALTTTLSAYTISCNTTANVTMASTDRFYLWVGINLTKTANTNFNGELDIEGALNGNYDSQITVPLATPAPTLSSLVPSSGAVGSVITIAGNNFRSVQGGSTVKFNGQLAGVSSWNNTTVIATVPTTATTGSVVVTVGGPGK
jgi:hypothetical protein